jgi:nucleotide-binding universal stress UspA family protein
VRRQHDGIGAVRVRALTAPSLVDALHDLLRTEAAAMLVVGSSLVGQLGGMVSHGAGARLVHAAPCAVAVVPAGYRARRSLPIRRIGVAFDGTLESRAAVVAAVAAVHAFGAELEVLESGAGDARLALHSQPLDLLIVGSRGYGVMRPALARGVSGRVVRSARCPVIAVPRGAEALLFGAPVTR